MNKDITFIGTDGEDYSATYTNREVTYSPAHNKVNNIVIHNPVSTEDAVNCSY
jgi:hypothetical protein